MVKGRRLGGLLLRGLLGIVAAAALGLGGVVLWASGDPPFLERLLTYPHATAVTEADWYQPREVVAGAQSSRALPRAEAEEVGVTEEGGLAEIEAWAERMRSSALLVMVDGRVVLERSSGGPERAFNTFSMAKTILGLLVGLAIEEGAIRSLREPAATYLPEWRGDRRREITVEDLLRMQSGLRSDGSRVNPFSDLVAIHLSSELERFLLAIPAVRRPGQRWEYSNVGSQALGLVVERATGRRYAEYLSEKLWRPLGASDGAVWLDREGGRAKTYCCLLATARGWARVGEMMRLGGVTAEGERVVPEAWIEAMRTPTRRNPRYGLHLWLHEPEGAGDPDFFYLDGMARQRVWVVPEARAVVVRIGERPLSPWDEAFVPRAIARATGYPEGHADAD